MTPYITIEALCASETAKRLRLPNEPPDTVIAALERTLEGCHRIIEVLGRPIRVHSGYRSPPVNKAVGGAQNSQHVKGEAVDFSCPSFGTPQQIFDELKFHVERLGIDQLILEPGWVHVSFADNPRHQLLRLA